MYYVFRFGFKEKMKNAARHRIYLRTRITALLQTRGLTPLLQTEEDRLEDCVIDIYRRQQAGSLCYVGQLFKAVIAHGQDAPSSCETTRAYTATTN
jgi:hypothetical protein